MALSYFYIKVTIIVVGLEYYAAYMSVDNSKGSYLICYINCIVIVYRFSTV